MLSLEETGLDSRRSSSIIVTLHDQVVTVQWFERGRRFNLFRGISISRFKVQETCREPVNLKMFFISTLEIEKTFELLTGIKQTYVIMVWSKKVTPKLCAEIKKWAPVT